ncbi:MAG: hypothetical protein J7M40_18900 [Planctomycetes bacterium]|nr:hypothetical protein [Planctomycetota bacterium]
MQEDTTTTALLKLVLSTLAICFIQVDNVLADVHAKEDIPFKIKGKLPDYEGIQAGDIELVVDTSIQSVDIPGFKKRMDDDGGVNFDRPGNRKEPSTLSLAEAQKMAEDFIARHFPLLSDKTVLVDIRRMMLTKFAVGGQKHTEVEGYSIKFSMEYKSIPILTSRISVIIQGDSIAHVSVIGHKVRQISAPRRCLSAEECFHKGSKYFPPIGDADDKPTLVGFGYCAFRQYWEEDRRKQGVPRRAVPAYMFDLLRNSFALDARTGELVYPQMPAGRESVLLEGPAITFSSGDAQHCFLVTPRDIAIRKAVFDIECMPVESEWTTFSVKEVFTETGQWGFRSNQRGKMICLTLNSNQDPTSTAKGLLHIDTPGRYEIEVLVCQGEANDPGCSVLFSLDGNSCVLGMKGPGTAHIWEKWGQVELEEGAHQVSLATAPGSKGYWEIGPVRVKNLAQPAQSGIKDLQIRFAANDRPDYSEAAPKPRFTTRDLGAFLDRPLKYSTPQDIIHRNVTMITFSSSSPGRLHISSLQVDFVTGDQNEAQRKAGQFLFVGPDGQTSRDVLIDDLTVISKYVENLVTQNKRRSVSRFRTAYQIPYFRKYLSRIAAECKHPQARRFRDDFENSKVELVRKEAQTILDYFKAYLNDEPLLPSQFPNGWVSMLKDYGTEFDSTRLKGGDIYFDLWDNPYNVTYNRKTYVVTVTSFGPNQKDNEGRDDDILASDKLD